MDSRAFKSTVYELSLYFERKPPKDETIRQWCDEVQSIPNHHIIEIMGAVKNLEAWPRNLPAFMRWKSAELVETKGENNIYAIHPRRLHPGRYAKADCKKCEGKGLYPFPMDWPVRRDENGTMITRKFSPQALCECTDGAEYGF
jgi:hypothetical protein